MAKSSKRAKRPAALAGIPRQILDLSPHDWPESRRALWCHAYLAGAAAPHQLATPTQFRAFSAAFHAGRQQARVLSTELAQVADVKRTAKVRSQKREIQRELQTASSRSTLLGRLSFLDDIHTVLGSPHEDQLILQMAGAALSTSGPLLIRCDPNPSRRAMRDALT